MGEGFSLLPLEQLLSWIMAEEKKDSLFGIGKDAFFRSSPFDVFRMQRFNRLLETPLGVAAGPHTQLAQNILCAWVCGARYIELKTVQTLDRITIPKPCIDIRDEGYNCEWSQELTLDNSFSQYLDAWILLHYLRRERFPSANETEPGFIFNMSVGYDMAGLLQENMQRFFDRMANCRKEKEAKIFRLVNLDPDITTLEIPDCISDNVTLSTMHGCPPEEIEKIGRYLLEQRGLHTIIKLNPTLLGAETVGEILNGKLGYEVVVPDEAFDHDLKFAEALDIIESLRETARRRGLFFGIKLANTLETVNTQGVLPLSQERVYMSGRALHPLAVELAAQLQDSFSGALDISFSAGADCFNFETLLRCGLKPVTVCTDLLKPGGYTRLKQYLEELSADFEPPSEEEAWGNLRRYAMSVCDEPAYRKHFFPEKSIKTSRPLRFFDCIEAPCVTACPVGQDTPAYMRHTAQGDYARAFETILNDNPFPCVTGDICPHPCEEKCTRLNYDKALSIRKVKAYAVSHALPERRLSPSEPIPLKVGIIGAGPSGLAAAFFLRQAGAQVEIWDANWSPGGTMENIIPDFRLAPEVLARDLNRMQSLGIIHHLTAPVDGRLFAKLREEMDYVYIAVGAPKSARLGIPGEECAGVYFALDFLGAVKLGAPPEIGPRVGVFGGGNTAVDAARAARKLLIQQGREGDVSVIYRRSRRQMPADAEETAAAEAEGVSLLELSAPIRIEPAGAGLSVTCLRMQLSEPDATGRRLPVPVPNSDFSLHLDTVIVAVGQLTNLDFLQDLNWRPVGANGASALENVYIGGDALRGPSNIISAAADGKNAAYAILSAYLGEHDAQQFFPPREFNVDGNELLTHVKTIKRRRERDGNPRMEARYCLQCSSVCNICVSVCPNRANIAFRIDPLEFPGRKIVARDNHISVAEEEHFQIRQSVQILNITNFCNECGNCRTFCPAAGAPYKDKIRLCLSAEAFRRLENGFYIVGGSNDTVVKGKFNGVEESLTRMDNGFIYRTPLAVVRLDPRNMRINNVEWLGPETGDFEISLERAITMRVLADIDIHVLRASFPDQ